jgi:hypothetical protein
MSFAELSTVRHHIRLGVPLPFSVRHADHTLLLARGHVLRSEAQLQALVTRGALVDLTELGSPRERVQHAQREHLPQMWRQCLQQVDATLREPGREGFREALDDAAEPVLALIERDPDLAIFQMLRRHGSTDLAYGVLRSLHSAMTAWLVAQRLGWDHDEALRGFKVALTMNLSMLELQGELAQQNHPLTPEQRHGLATHPMRSVQMLQSAGVADSDWLQAVLEHHEQEDGGGYPAGKTDVGDLASLARRADLYTAKLSSRGYRSALTADIAGRQMFMQDPGHPMTAALVKEFGIYPPGCHVRLAGGELAVVVQRGPTITTPVVLCLTDGEGHTLPVPQRRDTGDKRHAVLAIVGEAAVDIDITAERLIALGVV